jgi:hypothetical protein
MAVGRPKAATSVAWIGSAEAGDPFAVARPACPHATQFDPLPVGFTFDNGSYTSPTE